jgi:acyl carrier protein
MKVSKDLIWPRVLRIMEEGLGIDEVNMHGDMTQNGMDSLDVIDLQFRVEREFGVTIPDEAMMEMRTPADLVDWLEKSEKKSPDYFTN